MKRQLLGCAFFVLVCGLESIAAMNGAIWYTGRDQGPIEGDNEISGREGSSVVMAYYEMFTADPIPETCRPGKENQTGPFTIVKPIDAASTNLLLAFKNREPIDVVLKLYRVDSTGTEEVFFTITLTKAIISGIRQELPFTKDPQSANYVPMERVSFVYGSLTWDHADTELDTTMEWEARCDINPFSDLNFDGVVNILDFSIMADEWLKEGY